LIFLRRTTPTQGRGKREFCLEGANSDHRATDIRIDGFGLIKNNSWKFAFHF
jgi:hypothetical protein